MKTTIRNVLLLIGYFIIIGFIFISFLAQDEGTLGDNILLNFFADYLFFLAIPAALFSRLLAQTGLNNIQYIFIAIFLSAVCYLFLTLWILAIKKKKTNNKN